VWPDLTRPDPCPTLKKAWPSTCASVFCAWRVCIIQFARALLWQLRPHRDTFDNDNDDEHEYERAGHNTYIFRLSPCEIILFIILLFSQIYFILCICFMQYIFGALYWTAVIRLCKQITSSIVQMLTESTLVTKIKVLYLYSAASRICRLSGAVRHRQGWRSAYSRNHARTHGLWSAAIRSPGLPFHWSRLRLCQICFSLLLF